MNDDYAKRRNARLQAERRKRIALAQLRGEPVSPVPAAPIRQRARELTALGWSAPAILAAANVQGSPTQLLTIINGATQRSERKFAAIAHLPVSLAVPESVSDEMLIPSLGASRRVRALMALGWRHEDISEMIGGRASHHISAHRYPSMNAHDWRLVDAAYERLSAVLGGSNRTRMRAARSGFAPPLAWDNIDDPNETPSRTKDKRRTEVDHAVVGRILGGDYRLRANAAERAEVIARWRGDLNDLARLTGWAVARDKRAGAA